MESEPKCEEEGSTLALSDLEDPIDDERCRPSLFDEMEEEGWCFDGEDVVRGGGGVELDIEEDMVVEDAREEVEVAYSSDEAACGSGPVRREEEVEGGEDSDQGLVHPEHRVRNTIYSEEE